MCGFHRRRILLLLGIIFSASVSLYPISTSALEPSEILILYNAHNAQSHNVADYYAHARAIPHENIAGIDCTAADSIDEEQYRESVVPQVRKALAAIPSDRAIKCLVTVFGMPLMIGPAHAGPKDRAETIADQKRLDDIMTDLENAVAAYSRIAVSDSKPSATAPPASVPATRPKITLQEIVTQLNTAASDAGHRLANVAGADHTAAVADMERLQERIAGLAGVLTLFQVKDDSPTASAAHEHLNALQSQLDTLNTEFQLLSAKINDPQARQQLQIVQREARGLLGEARELQLLLNYLSPADTEACFDNELALVNETREYPRARWLTNPNNVEYFPSFQHQPEAQRLKTLLVSRLDGLTRDSVLHMIDTTLTTEKSGLNGKLYLDARGRHGTDGYAAFDADIRETADWIQNNSTMEVILDDADPLFQAKNCPNAALYCGWYSLRNYQDSCQWLPGAVGYHVASYEMVSLHDPNEKGWVLNLLSRGFCGTLGATAEPFLDAFPKPSKFFPLLLSGLFTQGEVWEVTCPMVSWRIGYVGDPLYNPFKTHPRVTEATLRKDTVLRNAFEILRGN